MRNSSRLQIILEEKMGSINRHVDVSHLTEAECNTVINVISKDILIRKSEKDRIGCLKKRFEDFRRAILLSNSNVKKRVPFDDYCLICGKHLFTFICFLHRGEECISCESYCCPSCRQGLVLETKSRDQSFTEYFFICKLCIEKREMKSRSSEWFIEAVEKRFKRFGSAKVLRAIYKQRKNIEPKVITLLALCRELQPSRKMSYIQRKLNTIPYRNDETQIGGYSSSFSDFENKDFEHFPTERRRLKSESEVERVVSRPVEIRGSPAYRHSSFHLNEEGSMDCDNSPQLRKSTVKLTIQEESSTFNEAMTTKKKTSGKNDATADSEDIELLPKT